MKTGMNWRIMMVFDQQQDQQGQQKQIDKNAMALLKPVFEPVNKPV
jgi:hypothetical protein